MLGARMRAWCLMRCFCAVQIEDFPRSRRKPPPPTLTTNMADNLDKTLDAMVAEQKKAIREAVALANEEGFPKDPEEVEAYFMQEVAQGEGMVQKGMFVRVVQPLQS
ncbi:hypothetical protein EON62_06405 [archaeon]|nr:MAG: hypothetical protein EON62_06405 [archaeon]